MARTTLDDKARKSRIREREYRNQVRKLRKLDTISDTQIAQLKQIKTAEAGKPLTAASIANWKELRDMGAVREQEGNLVLTRLGVEVINQVK